MSKNTMEIIIMVVLTVLMAACFAGAVYFEGQADRDTIVIEIR